MLNPGAVTRAFEKLAYRAELPPIRLHDLRHSAASIMHAAKVDMVTISRTLGHANLAITVDTYTTVFGDVDPGSRRGDGGDRPESCEVADVHVLRPRPRGGGCAGGIPGDPRAHHHRHQRRRGRRRLGRQERRDR